MTTTTDWIASAAVVLSCWAAVVALLTWFALDLERRRSVLVDDLLARHADATGAARSAERDR